MSSGLLHAGLFAALLVSPSQPMAIEPPPFGTLVSGAQLDAMVAAASAPPAPAPAPPPEEAAEVVAPAPPPPPKQDAVPIPDTPKPDEPKPPKVEEKKKEVPPPPPPKKDDKLEKKDKDRDKDKDKKDKQDPKKTTPEKPPKVDAKDTKKTEDPFRAPTKAEELALAERMKALDSKVAKAGVPVGIPWGVEGAKGELASDACKAALQQYGAEVIKKVRAAVTYPDQVRGLSADLRLQLSRDGALINQWVDSSSGNHLFDASLLDAIKKAAPFPILPACWREDTFMGLIHFVPEEGGAG